MTGTQPFSLPPFSLPNDEAELRQHVEFVRRLAGRLAVDPATSEDLAQETWLATLERRAPPVGSLRAWLARVLRNRAGLRLRRAERRLRRETERARSDVSAPTSELLEKMELHGRVVASVLALPDVQREVVVRRYFEDESTPEIARRLGIPESTVRTRLVRAHERLRASLEAHFGGDRRLCAVALSTLAGESTTTGAPLSIPASLASSLLMKKTLAVLALVVLAVLALRLGSTERTREPADPVPSAASRPAAAASLVRSEAFAAPPERIEPARAPVERADVQSTPAPETVDPPIELPVEERTAWLEFHVRDALGHPVPEARVRVDCYRTREDPGSSHSIGDMPVAETDRDGIARIEYPRRLAAWNGPERREIGAVCFAVEHPEFVTLRNWKCSVDGGPVEVVLQHGALLIVAGFQGERANVVHDVVPHLSDEVRVGPGDWVPARDGRPSCSRLAPGRHALWLTRAGADGEWASEVVEFELAQEEVRELTLELHPPRALVGMLDAAVPRPVRDGEVLLNLYVGQPEDRTGPRTTRLFGARVEADGSFRISGLPPGSGEMIGMCEGWVSRKLDAAPGEESPREHQEVDPGLDEPFVLAMERTARLELLALDPDENPVEGAAIQMWPNVHWAVGYSEIFLEREWRAVTDASGRAELENIPAGEEFLGLVHRSFCLPMSGERRWAVARLVAGETTALELRLEPRGDEQ